MDSGRLFFKFANEFGLVSVNDIGDFGDDDVFHHLADAGYTTSRTFLDNLPSNSLLDAFICTALGGSEALQSKAAVGLRKLQARAARLAKADRSFAKHCASAPTAPTPLARSTTCSLEQTGPAGSARARPSIARPADRRPLRAALARRRTELLSGEATEAVASSVPSLIFHLRRAAGRLLLQAAPAEGLVRGALPTLGSFAWLETAPAPALAGQVTERSAEAALVDLELELLQLRSAAAAAGQAEPAGPAPGADDQGPADSIGAPGPPASPPDRLAAADRLLCALEPATLARRARQLHVRCRRLCREIAQALGESPASASQEFGSSSPNPRPVAPSNSGEGGRADAGKWAHAVELSQEQWKVVACPVSIFLQGRSGTGKTLVLVRRLLSRRSEFQNAGGGEPAQLFVTKSSMLLNEVASQLAQEGCTPTQPRWPPRGLLCVTWDQLVCLLAATRKPDSAGPAVPKSGATLSYARFLSHYWPRLRGQARQLPALLVWTEFHNKLRSFNSDWNTTGLPLKEYLEQDLAAVGIRLDREDLRTVHALFLEYCRMKRSAREFDDTDVAMLVRSYALSACLHELYVDEAQDFSPTELAVLLSLCKNPYGVSVAGDTCQTVNPGSAFSFADIAEAFARHGGAGLEGHRAEAFRAQARECELLQLRYNYRCPAGVAGLAGSVSRLLLQRFPRCADPIEEVTLQPVGALPVFVELPGARPSSCIQGEGARRLPALPSAGVAVLVRSDEARQRLRREGVAATVLTVAEAKGLEFELVVLCGLLTDCPDSTLWRLADEQSEETGLAAYAASVQEVLCAGGAVASMSNHEHRRLCRVVMAIPELKNLYVALTRARAGCVMLECKNDPGVWASILKRWDGLVEHWSGVRSYLLESASGEDSVPAALPQAEAESSGPSLPATSAEMSHWIDRELATREGRMHKKAKGALTKERLRLRKGGDLDEKFCAAFEESFGIRQAAEVQSAPSDAATEPLPSFVPVMERRFGTANATSLSSPAKLGFQMLSHAMDNPRERWHVFMEARRALLEAIDSSDSVFAARLQLPEPWRTVPRAGETPESRAASLISALFRGAQERKRLRARCGDAWPETLGASVRRLQATRHLRMIFRRQLCTVLQEATHTRSQRGSMLARLRSLPLWRIIFSFLKPTAEEDVGNAVVFTAEQLCRHSRSHAHLVRGAVLAGAWHLLGSSRFDHAALEREEGHLEAVRAAAPHPAQAAASAQVQGASARLRQLLEATAARGGRCERAGAAFLRVQQWRFAAEAFDEAESAHELVPELVGRLRLQRSKAWAAVLPDLAANAQAKESCSAKAARCWLLAARQAGCAGPPGREALCAAAAALLRCRRPLDAAACLARAGQLRAALRQLAAAEAPAAAPLGLLCAALLGELGAARAAL